MYSTFRKCIYLSFRRYIYGCNQFSKIYNIKNEYIFHKYIYEGNGNPKKSRTSPRFRFIGYN